MPHKKLFILGTRGIPAAHGGFETFAQDLSLYLVQQGWDVTVYCQSNENKQVDWQGIHCHHIAAPDTTLGTALFDLKSLLHAMKQDGLMLTLGYNTGFLNFLPKFKLKKQIINMDGIEWRRGKWSLPYKIAFYLNYLCAGVAGNILIADNPGIQEFLEKNFKKSKIRMIAYGSNRIENADLALLDPFGLQPDEYAIVIARPEPENNIYEIVKAWSSVKRQKKLVILGKFDNTNPYHYYVRKAASEDVIFPGAIYDPAIIRALRFYTTVYIHGHTVGGTNPSLVEALGAGNAVIAHDNVYNRWTAGKAALYFQTPQELKALFDRMDKLDLVACRKEAVLRHQQELQMTHILKKYENLFESVLN